MSHGAFLVSFRAIEARSGEVDSSAQRKMRLPRSFAANILLTTHFTSRMLRNEIVERNLLYKIHFSQIFHEHFQSFLQIFRNFVFRARFHTTQELHFKFFQFTSIFLIILRFLKKWYSDEQVTFTGH